MKIATLLLAAAGIVLLTVIVGWLGAGRIIDSALSVGWTGFGELVCFQLVVMAVLATTWRVAVPTIGWRRLLLGRLVREGATNCLPFSPLGGIAACVRAVTGRGVGGAASLAATVVDVTLETIAMLGFVAIAIAALVLRAQDSRLAWPIGAGLGVMAVAVGAFVWLQKGGGRLARRLFLAVSGNLARQWRSVALGGMTAVQDGFERAYDAEGSRARLLCAGTLHLACWAAGAVWTWFAYAMLGAGPTLWDCLAIEGSVTGIQTLSFFVPASLGVQEAAYAALGGLFGIPADLSIGLSLVKRARDLAIGVPVLLAWQGLELRRIGRRARPEAVAPASVE